MKYKFSGFVVLVCAVVACGCGKKEGETLPGPSPTTEFHGTWNTVAPTKKEHEAMIKFEDDVLYLMDIGGRSSSQGGGSIGGMPRGEKDRYYVFTAQKHIDVTSLEGDHEGKTRRGIYEFEGNKLKICIGNFGHDRPTEFVAGLNTVLWVLERKK